MNLESWEQKTSIHQQGAHFSSPKKLCYPTRTRLSADTAVRTLKLNADVVSLLFLLQILGPNIIRDPSFSSRMSNPSFRIPTLYFKCLVLECRGTVPGFEGRSASRDQVEWDCECSSARSWKSFYFFFFHRVQFNIFFFAFLSGLSLHGRWNSRARPRRASPFGPDNSYGMAARSYQGSPRKRFWNGTLIHKKQA